jgi:hypothetical protein
VIRVFSGSLRKKNNHETDESHEEEHEEYLDFKHKYKLNERTGTEEEQALWPNE